MSGFNYIYLHGFASGPQSSKATFFAEKLKPRDVIIPDLNAGDFTNLTLSRQLNQVSKLIINSDKPIILFGSSMGGLTAMLLAERHPQIAKTVLLAPAFKMSKLWADADKDKLRLWQKQGEFPIMHYVENKEIMLNYNFYLDLFSHDDANFNRQLNVLIFHGVNDDIVPIEFSREYASNHALCKLIELDDDHSLNNHLELMWHEVQQFIPTI